jgi:hypothetical protein
MHIFKVPYATAELDGKGVKVRLSYPDNREKLKERLPANPEYGVATLSKLLYDGRVDIASPAHPARPASGGVLDVVSGKLVSHRRDKGTKVNPMHHGIASGFPASEKEAYFPTDIACREGGEEHLFVTREKPHTLIVPKDPIGKAESIARAQKLGLDASRHVEAGIEYAEGPDTLEICGAQGTAHWRYRGHIGLAWDSEMAINFYLARVWDFDPENILPIDAEGMEKEGRFIHFNREIFVFDRRDLEGMKYGDRIPNAIAYRLNAQKEPELQPEAKAPEPYIFRPDDALTRMLYGTGVWKGNWIEGEIEREKRKISQK